MHNPDTIPVATGLVESSSHITTSDNIFDDFIDLTNCSNYDDEAYVGDGSVGLAANEGSDCEPTQAFTARVMTPTTTYYCNQGVDPSVTSTEIGQTDQDAGPSHYLKFTSNVVPYSAQPFMSSLLHPIPFSGHDSTQVDGVDRLVFQSNTETATLPPSSDYATPKTFCSASPEPLLPFMGEWDPEMERERPFLSDKTSSSIDQYLYTTISPPLEHNGLEGEAEISSASSAGQAQGSTSDNPTTSISESKSEECSREAETPAGPPAGDRHCPGISGQNQAEIKAELARLLKIADANGAEARNLGLEKITKNGNTFRCIECGKTGRRDRLLDHILYRHLDLKTWSCSLCLQSFTTRDNLSQHLKAIKVACFCGHDITKNNWYEHSKKCKACLEVDGPLVIKKGRLVVQPTVAQAPPSVPGPSRNELEGEGQAHTPRTPLRRPVAVQNVSRKRKASEFDGENGDEIQEKRKTKRIKRDRA